MKNEDHEYLEATERNGSNYIVHCDLFILQQLLLLRYMQVHRNIVIKTFWRIDHDLNKFLLFFIFLLSQ